MVMVRFPLATKKFKVTPPSRMICIALQKTKQNSAVTLMKSGRQCSEWGGGRGVKPTLHNCTRPWHLCFPRVGPLKTPPPISKCFKLRSITRNKTCSKNNWVTSKTVLVPQRHKGIMMTHCSGTLTLQEHYDDWSRAQPIITLVWCYRMSEAFDATINKILTNPETLPGAALWRHAGSQKWRCTQVEPRYDVTPQAPWLRLIHKRSQLYFFKSNMSETILNLGS